MIKDSNTQVSTIYFRGHKIQLKILPETTNQSQNCPKMCRTSIICPKLCTSCSTYRDNFLRANAKFY